MGSTIVGGGWGERLRPEISKVTTNLPSRDLGRGHSGGELRLKQISSVGGSKARLQGVRGVGLG